MSTLRRKSHPGARTRARGQSVPLIAIILVVLVAMVGLSVDVGNTFSEEREAVLAANSASLNGMNEVLKRSNSNNQLVYDIIKDTLASNRVNAVHGSQAPGPGQITWKAFYLDRDGQLLTEIKRENSAIPDAVAYVNVVLDGDVDTYFARVVGRNDLPIDASAYAGVCPASKGVYPIGVNSVMIDRTKGEFRVPQPDTTNAGGGQTFNYQWTRIANNGLNAYAGKTRLNIPLKHKFPGSAGTGGNFGYLDWTGAPGSGSAGNTAERMWFPGNLDKGYEEVPVAEVKDLPNYVPGWKPNNVFEVGDWVRGDNGFSFGGNSSNGINQALLDHITRGTKMILPIYDPLVDETGGNAKFKVVDLGLFAVTAISNNGDDSYIQLVYLGDPTANQGVCNLTAVTPNPETCCELGGNVDFWPQYEVNTTQRTPVRYVVVMDLSGSMSANFAGMCNYKNNSAIDPIRCTASTDQNGNLTSGLTSSVGPDWRWGSDSGSEKNQRRIIVARNAVESLIGTMNMQENGGYKPAPYEDEMAFLWFGAGSGAGNVARFNAQGTYSTGGSERFSATPAGLVNAVRAMMPDKTDNLTNAAAGLYQAYQVLTAAPTRYSTTGQPVLFKNVVILVTDGISNVQFHKDKDSYNAGMLSSRNNYPNNSRCKDSQTVLYITSDSECMQNAAGWKPGVTPKRVDQNPSIGDVLSRPITQVGEVSTTFLKAPGPGGGPLAEVFVVGLSGASESGMAAVVTGSTRSNYISVLDGNLLDDTFRNIYNRTSSTTCQPGVGVRTGVIPSTEFVAPAGSGLSHPNVGWVTLSGKTYLGADITMRTPIVANRDPSKGTLNRLSYQFANLVPPGEYKLTAEITYNHPQDVFKGGRGYLAKDIPVTVSATSQTGSLTPRTTAHLELNLNGQICPVTPPTP